MKEEQEKRREVNKKIYFDSKLAKCRLDSKNVSSTVKKKRALIEQHGEKGAGTTEA